MPTKVHLVKAMFFPVVMYGCESWTVKKAACWELMLSNCGVGDDSWASLGLQGKQSIRSEEDQPLDNFGRNYAKAEAPVLWPPHEKSWLIGKDSDAGRDWGQAENGTTEYEMVPWHHWLDGCESEWTLGFGDGQGGLACCDSWGHKELDMIERLNWTELNWISWSGLPFPSPVDHILSDLSTMTHPSCMLWEPNEQYEKEKW